MRGVVCGEAVQATSLRRLVEGYILILKTEAKFPRTVACYEGNLAWFLRCAEREFFKSPTLPLREEED